MELKLEESDMSVQQGRLEVDEPVGREMEGTERGGSVGMGEDGMDKDGIGRDEMGRVATGRDEVGKAGTVGRREGTPELVGGPKGQVK